MTNRFYDSEGCPVCCPFCYSKKINDSIQSIDGGIASEIQYHCSRCKNIIGYWAYGSYDPSYKKEFDCTIFSMRHWKYFFFRLDSHIWKLKTYQNFILWLFKPRFSVANPLFLVAGFVIYFYNVFYRLCLKVFNKPEVTRFCDNCNKEIGTSLWGYCSAECLEKLTKSANELYEEKNNNKSL